LYAEFPVKLEPGDLKGFPIDSDSKESACDAGDLDSIPGLERYSGEENGYPLHYSCLENSMDRRAGCRVRQDRVTNKHFHKFFSVAESGASETWGDRGAPKCVYGPLF